MVRLRARVLGGEWCPPQKFQFQYGAIESFSPNSEETDRLRVISIPVWCDWENAVRTKKAIGVKFQFQYGAIESFLSQLTTSQSPQFQFQYGAIERPYMQYVICCQIQFQFQYGAIESQPCREHRPEYPDFNSSMVRLRVSSSPKVSLFIFRISIPVWCDWESLSDVIEPTRIEISIPVWCDWEGFSLCSIAERYQISIPVWCDWEHLICKINYHIVEFQFQYGAIERGLLTYRRNIYH